MYGINRLKKSLPSVYKIAKGFKDKLFILRERIIFNKNRFINKDISNIDTIAVIIGPYRNLTSLVAAALNLHPEIQILNHAHERVLGRNELNFVRNFSKQKLDLFCKFALVANKFKGLLSYGGNVFFSHSFQDHKDMQAVYFQRFPLKKFDDVAKALVWKANLHMSQELRKQKFDFEKVFEQEPRLKFIMPLRNQEDCARSNLDKGQWIFFDEPNNSFEGTLKNVKKEHEYVLNLKAKYPDRILIIPESDIGSLYLLREICSFLRIGYDRKWVDACNKVFIVKKSTSPKR